MGFKAQGSLICSLHHAEPITAVAPTETLGDKVPSDVVSSRSSKPRSERKPNNRSEWSVPRADTLVGAGFIIGGSGSQCNSCIWPTTWHLKGSMRKRLPVSMGLID